MVENRDLKRPAVGPLHGCRTPALEYAQRTSARCVTSPDLDCVILYWDTKGYCATTYFIEKLGLYQDGRITLRSRLDHVSICRDGASGCRQGKVESLG